MDKAQNEPSLSGPARGAGCAEDRTPAIRRDGWTVARQQAFLKALTHCGCVSHAVRAVGMSRQSFYDLHDRPAAHEFRRAVEAALDCAMPRLDQAVISRSIHGVPRPVFYKGEQVGEYRHFDERLAMFLLRCRLPHRYGPQLDRSLPERPPGCDDEPDPDEALGRLDWHLGGLVDEADLPGAADPDPCANDSVNFVNFDEISEPNESLGANRQEGPREPGGCDSSAPDAERSA